MEEHVSVNDEFADCHPECTAKLGHAHRYNCTAAPVHGAIMEQQRQRHQQGHSPLSDGAYVHATVRML